MPRKKSYAKDFKYLRFGIIELQEGQNDLALRALHISGKPALEFRLLMLRRLLN